MHMLIYTKGEDWSLTITKHVHCLNNMNDNVVKFGNHIDNQNVLGYYQLLIVYRAFLASFPIGVKQVKLLFLLYHPKNLILEVFLSETFLRLCIPRADYSSCVGQWRKKIIYNGPSSRFNETLRNCASPLAQHLRCMLRHRRCASGLARLRKVS